MIMAMVATAAGLAAPSLTSIFTIEDYPTWAVAREASAASFVRLLVDPKGKVLQCQIQRQIGDQRLAKEICQILRRKRIRPPTLRDGQKVHAVIDTLITMFLPDTVEGKKIMALRESPDAELTVNELPNNEPADVSVVLAYDAAGKVMDCMPSELEKQLPLANVACSQRALFDNAIQNDLNGRPIPYVTSKRIRFTVLSQPK